MGCAPCAAGGGVTRTITVAVRTIGEAGWYSLDVSDLGSVRTVSLPISFGEPKAFALRGAELLAVALDCRLTINGQMKREPMLLHGVPSTGAVVV